MGSFKTMDETKVKGARFQPIKLKMVIRWDGVFVGVGSCEPSYHDNQITKIMCQNRWWTHLEIENTSYIMKTQHVPNKSNFFLLGNNPRDRILKNRNCSQCVPIILLNVFPITFHFVPYVLCNISLLKPIHVRQI